MKKYILSLILLVLVFSSAFATKHNHADENEVRYVKKNVELNPQYQQQLRNTEMWQNFMAENPNWFVIFNERNQLPHRAFGAPIPTTDLQSFLTLNNFILPTDLREASVVKNAKYINKIYTQYYNNLEVIGSRLYAKFTLNNELVAFGLDIFNDINISTSPTLDPQSAIASATSDILNSISDIEIQEDLKVLANPNYRKYEYHLVYEISFSTRIQEGPANYICYVDANTGELLMRKNTVMYEAPPTGTATVSGDVYMTNPYDPLTTQNFRYLKAIDQSTNTNYYTDMNGMVVLQMNIGEQVRYKLEGLYADVQTSGSTPDIIQNLAVNNTIVFDNSNSTSQERTAYWSVNQIHDHLKIVFPTYTGLDSPLPTNIDESGSCNAYFNGSSINFYAEGGGCNATAKLPDVVYHEYGHAINGGRYNSGSGMWNGALNEGFADIWAISLTESPVLGYGWDLSDPTISVRRYDQDRKVYPQDLVGEVHADGEIIAGSFWDLYLNLGSMPQMLDLFKYTFDSNVDGPDGDEGAIYTDILLEVLYADDNDANLSNGTPNDIAIVSAFALHGITLLSNAVISHIPVSSSVGNVDITINASVGITYPWALGSTNCFYRLNDATTWNNLTMSGVSSFTTTIPAQPNGTVIAYYLSLTDNYGTESGITPMAANLSPLNNANVPYFVLVGYELLAEEDFDFNFGFWQTGDVNDNATTGMWEIGSPIGSYGDVNDPSTICQTDAQHTIGGFQCAFTGNASSSSAGIGENDVDDGHTTLFSPFYDLTGYSNPAFSYYRWYTNSPASGANPGADWWQVLITDDGVNWHYVENNMSSDINWRRFAFRVQDYVSLTNVVQLKFIASDSTHLGQNLDGGSLIEGAVDDLYLYEAQGSTSINEVSTLKPKLIKITDILGREVNPVTIVEKTTLFYIYDDGTVEKRIF
ncbi:PepSY domain-containing protein [Flavobacteriales bacterium]|nr:PepSY domain-containing protein [Flavobacteriales bacterium]